jgi:hypothetical protein
LKAHRPTSWLLLVVVAVVIAHFMAQLVLLAVALVVIALPQELAEVVLLPNQNLELFLVRHTP